MVTWLQWLVLKFKVSAFRQLRMLVKTCVASIGALGWSMVLLLLLKLSFALAICQALQGYIQDENENYESRMELYVFYGSFLRALYTMFEITHSGSWPSRVRPVIDRVSAWYAVAFLGYITLVPRSMNLNSRAKSWNKPSMFIHVYGKTMKKHENLNSSSRKYQLHS